jgi:hypothetical protein
MAESHTLLVFSNPVSGQEAEYQDWYRTRHLGEVTSIDGVLFGRFYEIAEMTGSAPMAWTHMARYALADDPSTVVARVYEANASGRMPVPDWITDVGAWFFTADDADGTADQWETGSVQLSIALARTAEPPAATGRAWTYSGVPFDPDFPSPWEHLVTSVPAAQGSGDGDDGGLVLRLTPLVESVHHAQAASTG